MRSSEFYHLDVFRGADLRIRVNQIEVPEDDPFKYDLLEREKIAEFLLSIVGSYQDGLVMALNAPWGHGKSTFLRMWRALLKKEGFRVISLNAWETDFSGDPLLALLGEFSDQLEVGADGDGLRDAYSRVKRAGAGLVRRAVPALVKAATMGGLDINELHEDLISDVGEKFAEEKIKNYEDSKKSISHFRAALSDLAYECANSDDGVSRPLVVIVDELDRCRPDYAIRVLECIKHLFSVDGVVFVISVDRSQLAHSVRSQYGAGMDADAYLRRFFDLELSIPEPGLEEFCKAQFDRFGLVEVFERRQQNGSQRDRADIQALLPKVLRGLGASLRDQERAFSLIALSLRSTPDNYYLFPELLTVMVAIKVLDPVLYKRFVSGDAPPEEVLDRVAPRGRSSIFDLHERSYLEAVLQASVCKAHERESLFKGYEDNANSAAEVSGREAAQHTLRVLGAFDFRHHFGCLAKIERRIDLVSTVANQ